MKKIALITDVEFWKNDKGNSLRINSIVEEIKNKVYLEVIFLGKIINKKKIEKKYNLNIIEIECYKQYFTNIIKKMINNFPELRENLKKCIKVKTINSYYNLKIKNKVDKILLEKKYDSLIVEYIWLDYLVENYKGYKIIDTHDIQSDRVESYKQKGLTSNFNISLEEEVKILNSYNTILTINDRDKDILLNSGIAKEKVLTLPLKIEIKKIHNLESEKIRLGFIGAAIDFNIDSIQKFISDIFPSLEKKFNIELCIYGSVSSIVKEQKNIKKYGFVKNINDAYENIDICINPIRIGGGLKIKNIEALSKGKLLITSNIGAQGLEDGVGKAFFVAETLKEWEILIKKILDNKELKAGVEKKALKYISKKFSIEEKYNELLIKIQSSKK